MLPLRQSTDGQVILLSRAVDSTDGNTEETALTIANTDIKIWKHNATAAVNKNSGGATHAANGDYYCTLDATDTNTVGRFTVLVHVTGMLYLKSEFVVYPQKIYDSLFAGTDNLEVDIVQVSGDSTAADNLEAACDGTGYNVGNGAVVAASVTGNVGGSVASVTAGVTVSDKTGFSLSSAGIQSVWEYSTRTLSSFGSLVSDIATAVWSAGARTLTGFGTLIADIWTYATRRLSDATNITSDGNTISQTQLANLDATITSRLATTGYTAPDNTNIGNIITAINHATYGLNALLTAINTRLATSGYTAPDNASITSILEDTGTTIPAQINGLNNLSSAQAQSAATAALTAYNPPTKAEMDAGHALLATAASIAALNNISTAQVLAQATAALEATITEPTDLTDLSAKGILYHLFSRFFHRNTQTATAQVTYKANGTTALATRTASDDGTTQELGKAT